MQITYLGHSCFLIEGRTSVITDPFDKIGYPLARVSADYVLVSHVHYDHNAANLVDGGMVIGGDLPLVPKKAEEDINLSAVQTFHDPMRGALRGRNTVFRFTVDGVRFTHLGDLGEDFSSSLASEIGDTDVLFIPVGGVYTIDDAAAEKFARAINPEIIVPMHFKTPRSTVGVMPVDGFLKRFDNVKYVPSSLKLTKNDLPCENTVYVFDYKGF